MNQPQHVPFNLALPFTTQTDFPYYIDGAFRGLFVERCDRDVILHIGVMQFYVRAGQVGHVWWGFEVDAADFHVEIPPAGSVANSASPLLLGSLLNVEAGLTFLSRIPLYSDQNLDSGTFNLPYWLVPDNAPVSVASSGLASSWAGEVVADHETNRRISQWGSAALNTYLRDYNVGAVGLYGISTITGKPVALANENGVLINGPVSIPAGVSVLNFPATQPVSGTFWQATQPVSGAFFQATQPVSIAGTVNVIDATAERATYFAQGRMTAMPRQLSKVFAAAGAQQFATLHHTALSTKTLRLVSCTITFLNISAAVEVNVFAQILNAVTLPSGSLAGGNTVITRFKATDAAAESILTIEPTTAGTNTEAFGYLMLLPGVTGAASTVNPPAVPPSYELVPNANNPHAELPTIPAGTAGGFAVQVNVSAAATVTCFINFIFTES